MEEEMPISLTVLADAQRKLTQKNTFTRWANERLKLVNTNIADLKEDLSDGVRFIALIEVLSGRKFQKYNKRPEIRVQRLENVSMALKFLEEDERIKIVNIDSSDIVDHKLKLILSLIWNLILHYSISKPSWEGDEKYLRQSQKSPQQRLLQWVQNKITEKKITNFTTDWNDGTAIGALVDAVAPGLCPDWAQWNPNNKGSNTTEAMNAAEEWLNIPQLITPAEMCNPKVDELSMMTYLSQFPNTKFKPGAPLRTKTNPAKVNAYGPGLEPEGNSVGNPARFLVETSSALEIIVLNPLGIQEPCEANINNDSNFTYSCFYVPTMEGQYKVTIKLAGREIPKSPFMVGITVSSGGNYTRNAGDPEEVDVGILDPMSHKKTVNPVVTKKTDHIGNSHSDPSHASRTGSGSDHNVSWSKPLCFIDTTSDGILKFDLAVVEKIRKITKPVVVVAIAGKYRTGKSYLMNRLAGESAGFALGSTVESTTKGIWIWCVKNPQHSDHVLLLLDTEGLGDVEKGDKNHDVRIFTLAVLLSSCLVHNSQGVIDQGALEDIHLVTEMTSNIKVKHQEKSEENAGTNFDLYFPIFIWALRDFTLELKKDDKKMTPDEYLEDSLTLKSDEKKKKLNEPKECIRRYFRKRYCYTFPPPVANHKKLKHLETIKFSELNPEFEEITQKFLEFIYKDAPVKRINGHPITGNVFASIAERYVTAINNNEIPCIESAVEVTAEIENMRALNESVALYRQLMDKISLPTETEQDFSRESERCGKEASSRFLKMLVFDKDWVYNKKFGEEMKKAYEELCKRNEFASTKKCREILENLFKPINKSFEDGHFSVLGGYKQYNARIEELIQTYKTTKGKGIMAGNELDKFLEETKPIATAIIDAERMLTGQQKEMADLKKDNEYLRQRLIDERASTNLMRERIKLLQANFESHFSLLEEQLKQQETQRQQELQEALNNRMEMCEKYKQLAAQLEIYKQKLEAQSGDDEKQQNDPNDMKRFESLKSKIEKIEREKSM